MSVLSYIVETNGDNGVHMEYAVIDYIPENIVWTNGVNSFGVTQPLPSPDDSSSPEYVRKFNGSELLYYEKVISVPATPSRFLLSVLINGSESGAYNYDTFSDFIRTDKDGNMIGVTLGANNAQNNRNGTITITDNMSGGTITIRIVQQYVAIGMFLETYDSVGIGGEEHGSIHSSTYTHTFHWLTNKTSPDMESLNVTVFVSGPRKKFIVYGISEYAYVGEMDSSYGYSNVTDSYYHTTQKCDGETLVRVQERVYYDETTEGVYQKVKYNGDLKVIKKGNIVTITNYGRCFLENDAYYVITLANVDDLRNTCEIIVKYANEGD